MIKLYIKPLLAIFAAMLLFGFLYLLFSQKPEMVSFEDRRVAEPEMPSFNDGNNINTTDDIVTTFTDQSALNTAGLSKDSPAARNNSFDEVGTNTVEAVIGDASAVIEPEAAFENVPENSKPEAMAAVPVSEAGHDGLVSVDSGKGDVIAPNGQPGLDDLATASLDLAEDIVVAESITTDVAAADEVFKEPEAKEVNDAGQVAESNSEVMTELNVPKPAPIRANLVDGEDLILNEINERIQKISKAISSELGFDSPDKPKPINASADGEQIDADEADSGFAKPKFKADTSLKTEQTADPVEETDAVIIDTVGQSPVETVPMRGDAASVLTMPEIDWILFDGDSADSLQYRESITKLRAVIAQTAEIDKENNELRQRFESLNEKNQELAVIIEDIDDKIKVLGTSN